MDPYNDENVELPAFVLAVFDDGVDDIELTVNIPEEPRIERHASLGLIYGLALLTLDRQGTISAIVEQFLAQGPMSEIDVANRIADILTSSSNDLPC